jgi:hypothetical protein
VRSRRIDEAINLLSQDFVHFKHVNLVYIEDRSKSRITHDLPLVLGILLRVWIQDESQWQSK